MTRRKVSQAISPTNGLDIVHVAFAAKIARCCQIDLKGLTCIAESINVHRLQSKWWLWGGIHLCQNQTCQRLSCQSVYVRTIHVRNQSCQKPKLSNPFMSETLVSETLVSESLVSETLVSETLVSKIAMSNERNSLKNLEFLKKIRN